MERSTDEMPKPSLGAAFVEPVQSFFPSILYNQTPHEYPRSVGKKRLSDSGKPIYPIGEALRARKLVPRASSAGRFLAGSGLHPGNGKLSRLLPLRHWLRRHAPRPQSYTLL